MDRGSETIAIQYYIENPTPIEQYTLDFLFRALRIKARICSSPEDAHIAYLEHVSKTLPATSILILKKKDDLIWEKLKSSPEQWPVPEDNQIPFDLIRSISFFLSDEGNLHADASAYDKHERLKYKSSFQFKHDIAHFPMVNRCVAYFRLLLEKKWQTKLPTPFPDGKKACVILSHDIDIPGKYDELKYFPWLPRKWSPKGILGHYKYLLTMIKLCLTERQKDEFWCFHEVYDSEMKFGYRSSNYFAVISRWEGAKCIYDVTYKIDHPSYPPVFERMKQDGFEIGLHNSYLSYQDEEKFRSEKRKLEQLCRQEIKGIRHHYWHLGKDYFSTLRKHEALGFDYDSSLSFNDHIGFRLNSALPYFPFDLKENRAIKVLQIPVLCMDGNMFYDEQMTVEKALQMLDEGLDVLRENQGVGSIDWHIRTSFPKGNTYRKWGECYQQLLQLIADKEDIWVATAQEVHDWWLQEL
ncbi:MAG: hypothetical protein EP338_09045 [Bacteroidetes bacterium]|nr:MAG: hypothetical protein EP338_09045 [Bacteroidota bacterium]